MLNDIIKRAHALQKVENYFPDVDLPENFNVPSSILLYCHNCDWPQTIMSSRYMLIIPFVDLTYELENNKYLLHCGQALLVKPYLNRSVPHLHEDYLRLIVSFELSGDQLYLPKSPLMTMTDSAWQLVELLLKNYEEKEIIPSSFSLTLLLRELAHNTIKTEYQKNSPVTSNVIHYVNQYLKQSFSIKDIASKVGLSCSHLRRQFQLEMGISLGKYIYRQRLNAAQRLLVDSNLRIEAIATRCGYDSIYSFSRFFKKNIGISPLRFRKQHQKS